MKKIALVLLVLASAAAAIIAARAIAADRAGSLVSPGPLSDAHAALQATCTSCHMPYERISGAACVRCHALADRLLTQERTAFHAYVPSCVECHVEHAGGSRPTHMDHDALVRLLAERTPAVADQALSCVACHGVEDPHGKTLGTECADCHGTETWRVPGFAHPSPRSRECARCHAAPPSHYMHHFMMSQQWAGEHAPVEQCFRCHQTTAWNDILNRGWIDHH